MFYLVQLVFSHFSFENIFLSILMCLCFQISLRIIWPILEEVNRNFPWNSIKPKTWIQEKVIFLPLLGFSWRLFLSLKVPPTNFTGPCYLLRQNRYNVFYECVTPRKVSYISNGAGNDLKSCESLHKELIKQYRRGTRSQTEWKSIKTRQIMGLNGILPLTTIYPI